MAIIDTWTRRPETRMIVLEHRKAERAHDDRDCADRINVRQARTKDLAALTRILEHR